MKTFDLIRAFDGKASYWFETLEDGKVECFNEHMPMHAASVMKLAVMVEYFRQLKEEGLDRNETVTVTKADHMPSCGALTYLHDGVALTLHDLCVAMIIHSDNTATNMLMRRVGMDKVNKTMRELGMEEILIERFLFDHRPEMKGKKNTVTAYAVARLYRMLYRGELISPEASREMIDILLDQRLNGKIPFFLESYTDLPIAHKTGEDGGVTHDTALILGKKPFILIFLGNEVDVPQYERLMQDGAWEAARTVLALD